jgi:hypothetical protein
MPITQSRMIALINAAHDFEQALDKAKHMTNSYWQMAHSGSMSWQEAFTLANTALSTDQYLQTPIQSGQTIAVERSHFKSAAKRNDRAAIRQANHRLRRHEFLDIGESTTAPHSLIPQTGERLNKSGLSIPPRSSLSPEAKARIDAYIQATVQDGDENVDLDPALLPQDKEQGPED